MDMLGYKSKKQHLLKHYNYRNMTCGMEAAYYVVCPLNYNSYDLQKCFQDVAISSASVTQIIEVL